MKKYFLTFLIIFIGLSFDRLFVFRFTLAACCIHECGHIAAYCLLTNEKPQISVSPFGFTMQNNVAYYKFNALILISGVLTNIIFATVCLGMSYIRFNMNCFVFAAVNIFIAFFNVTPVYFLD